MNNNGQKFGETSLYAFPLSVLANGFGNCKLAFGPGNLLEWWHVPSRLQCLAVHFRLDHADSSWFVISIYCHNQACMSSQGASAVHGLPWARDCISLPSCRTTRRLLHFILYAFLLCTMVLVHYRSVDAILSEIRELILLYYPLVGQ